MADTLFVSVQCLRPLCHNDGTILIVHLKKQNKKMETNITIEQVLENLIPEKIIKKKKTIWSSVTYLALGTAFFIINSFIPYNPNGFIYPLMVSLGSIFVTVAVLAFFYRKMHYFDVQTGLMLRKKDVFFDGKETTRLVKIITEHQPENLWEVKRSAVHALKLCIYKTSDNSVCFVQVLTFLTDKYEPLTDVLEYSNTEAQTLSKVLSI